MRDVALALTALAATAGAWQLATGTPVLGTGLPLLVATTLAVHSHLAMGRWRAAAQAVASGALLWSLGAGQALAATVVVTGLVSSQLLAGPPRRAAVLRAGAWAAAVAVASIVLGTLSVGLSLTSYAVAGAAIAGLLGPSLALSLGPALEWAFGHTSRLTMAEWLSYDHPLLSQLAAEAPGTFQHSVNVGILADAAAKAVRGDAFIARLGGVYHDIGKLRAPAYFIENQSGSNPHDDLPPWESARILRAHVLDGVELVRLHQMGDRIPDFIREHHGKGVMRLFRDKAASLSPPPGITESYQYPGPSPTSRESGIVMIADQVEATARSSAPADTAACAELVARTISRVEGQGELQAARLSERDLATIRDAMSRALASMYHHRRISYPPDRPQARPRLVAKWLGGQSSAG